VAGFLLHVKRRFGKLHVCTYICIVNLENAILSSKFGSQTQKAGLNVLYTAWWLKTLLSRELKALGLTHEQFNVLRILKGKHPEQMCVRDIARRMIEKNSNVPRIIDRLEIKKLVNRSTSSIDKRETVIKLTGDGMNILEIANKKVNELFKVVELTEEDATQLNELLEKMRDKE
jgi:DNA-binding MarR family transcriptional regulator